MKLPFLILAAGLLLSACATEQPPTASKAALRDAALQAVVAHRGTWSRHAGSNDPVQDPRDGTWRVLVGKIDWEHSLLDIPDPALFANTVREVRFRRDGTLLSYRKSSQP